MHTPAVIFEFRFCRRIFFGVGAPDHDIGTGLRQRFRHAQTDAAIAAGNQRDMLVEIKCLVHEPPSIIGWRWGWRRDRDPDGPMDRYASAGSIRDGAASHA